MNVKVTPVSMTSKDEWKAIVANAKFTEIQQLLMTKVGINNFIHLSLLFETSILMRDIIVNSPFVSAWGRSTQVLNDTDSKFSVYRPIANKYKQYHDEIIKTMEELFAKGQVQDDIRMLVPLGSITNYAITIDIMTAVKLVMVLDSVTGELAEEASIVSLALRNILFDQYGITQDNIETLRPSYKDDIKRDFQYCTDNLAAITGIESKIAAVTYSVVGQVLRHRTVLKKVMFDLADIQHNTANYDFDYIGTPTEISTLVKSLTANATSIYQTLQGSIATLCISGYEPAINKMMNQRSCCINDTKQFREVMPKTAIPPCKCNVEKFGCYVAYVNESRMKNEEMTQIPCPIYAESLGIKTFTDNPKYDYFYENITSWGKWKERISK